MICTIREIKDWMKDAGTPLKVLRISNGNKNNKAVWIDGGIHGNEWITTSVVTYIANELIKNWNATDVQNINWYILAVQSPDGYKYAYESDRFWRKNRTPTGQSDSIGIDLNRNYDFKWGESDSVGNPNDDTYGGKSAFSEHETSSIKTFILETMKGKFSAFISFQGYGQSVMYPGGNDEDCDSVEKAAIQGVKRMKTVDNLNYKVGTSQSLFNASAAGAASEWAKSVGIRYSYTVNLRDTGRYGSLLPPRFIETTAKEANAFVLAVLEAIIGESR
ncbi:carboxypeptidase B-like [Contarinia nasturtii]|uniref:carboxypeptidase B-like n=1 Tax=Contarinia nasturtii TaxID=265458 RepID=UPI0012D49FF6|nr:carboxypeptidase B-like [Contarinia nasturtii]